MKVRYRLFTVLVWVGICAWGLASYARDGYLGLSLAIVMVASLTVTSKARRRSLRLLGSLVSAVAVWFVFAHVVETGRICDKCGAVLIDQRLEFGVFPIHLARKEMPTLRSLVVEQLGCSCCHIQSAQILESRVDYWGLWFTQDSHSGIIFLVEDRKWYQREVAPKVDFLLRTQPELSEDLCRQLGGVEHRAAWSTFVKNHLNLPRNE